MDIVLFQTVSNPANSNLVDWMTLIVLFLTLCVVGAYTIITKKQTDELIKQRQISVMPTIHSDLDGLISRDLVGNHHFYPKLTITNVGNGLAIEIQAEKITLNNDLKTVFKFTEHLKYLPIDINDIDKNLKDYAYKEIYGKGISNDRKEILNYIKSKKCNCEMTFRFQDIEGRHYKVTNKIINGKYFQGITEPDFKAI